MQDRNARNGIVVAGAGVAGLALAAALARALRPHLPVILCDPALAYEPAADDRVSAIAAGARRLLGTVGAWERLTRPAQPIRTMTITDSRLEHAVRPTFLAFMDEIAPDEPVAHMVENRDLLLALRSAAEEAGVGLEATPIESFAASGESMEVHTAGGAMRCRLLVAADGARSRLRALAGIRQIEWSYGQSGIVATIGHERDHEGEAVQHFLPGGPFAILPLAGRKSSIVWTEPAVEAERLIVLDPQAFLIELERRFGLKLGAIEVISPPRAYALTFSVARSFVGERLTLVGDAAHVIHPIAGQGLNLGLRDAAALAECVTDAARLGLDVGAADVLDRYQQWRRFDTMMMAAATDALNRLFSNRSDALKLLRDIGLGVVERVPVLKDFFVAEAAGLTGKVPRLLRGEAL